MPSTLSTLVERARLLTIRLLTRLLHAQPVRLSVGGHEMWLIKGRFLPLLAGADGADDDEGDDAEDDDTADEEKKGDEDDDQDDDTADEDDDTADEDGADDDDEELSPKVKAILRKERKARREAERKLRDATKKPKPKSAKDDDDDQQVDAGSAKLQRANLLIALDRAGITGAQAKATARLLDVEYDEDDEPIDLDDAIDQAIEEYGETVVKGAKPDDKPRKKSRTNGDEGNGRRKGPKLTAAELAAAEEAGMKPERYAALKGVSNLEEFEALQAKEKKAAERG